MPVLTTKKRYRIVGDFSMRKRGGEQHEQLEHHFSSGDELPVELADSLSKGELAALTARGVLVEIGKPPAPKQAAVASKPPDPVQVLRQLIWSSAAVDGGLIVNGPRGCDIEIAEKQPSERDLKRVVDESRRDLQIIAHQAPGGAWVATVDFSRLARLLANRGLLR
jgi:hypothetical protein